LSTPAPRKHIGATPHSSYWIYNAAGKRIQTVENHISTIDEAPERVSLAPGSYTIRAWSDNDGLVTLPVVIKPIEVTHVNLEKERVTAKETVASRKTVSVPSAHVTACKPEPPFIPKRPLPGGRILFKTERFSGINAPRPK
jgi:hypothetical protein